MILLANVLLAVKGILKLLSGFLTIYQYIVLASVIISWVNADPYNPIVNFIYRVTEPVLRRVRRYMPNTGAIDFSPIVVFLLIFVVQVVILKTLDEYLFDFINRIRGAGI
jgi:YggT family protein